LAEFIRYQVSVTTMDGVERPAVFQVFVSEADAKDYLDAIDDAARAATEVGILITRYLAMQDGAFVKTSVGIELLNDPVTVPANTVLRGNKLLFHIRSGGRGLTNSISARKAAAFTQTGHELDIDLAAPAAMLNFVAQYNAVVVDMFGNPVTILKGEVVD